MYLQSKTKQRKKIDTSYLVCIFSVVVCYLSTKLCHPLPILIIRMELFFSHKEAIVWQQTSVVHSKQIRCSPYRHGPDQRRHKCPKNTRLSAGASVKTLLSSHLTKPASRKEKQERKALFSVQQQLEDTQQTQRKHYRNGWRAEQLPFMLPHLFLLLVMKLHCDKAK